MRTLPFASHAALTLAVHAMHAESDDNYFSDYRLTPKPKPATKDRSKAKAGRKANRRRKK